VEPDSRRAALIKNGLTTPNNHLLIQHYFSHFQRNKNLALLMPQKFVISTCHTKDARREGN
jgi:hypothetical protein